MKLAFRIFAATLAFFTLFTAANAEDIRSIMESENVKWLTAYNTNTPVTFNTLYTKDAMLMPPGLKPISGSAEIAQFWEARNKTGNKKDHTFEILNIAQDGKFAYQINRWSVAVIKDNGDRSLVVGNSTRIFEHQDDGAWRIKLHIWTIDQ
jgi:ketosteroid isomerase-like protein